MVFENPNDRALLERELEKHGLSLKTVEEFINATVEAVEQVVEAIKEIFYKAFKAVKRICLSIIDAVLCTINTNPKNWHYYKHAKKFRTRKKYQNRLLKNATEIIKKRGF